MADFLIHSSASHVSVTHHISVAEASNIGQGKWYLNRVKVNSEKGLGLGTRLLQKLLQALQERGDFREVVVEPGGYGSDIKKLVNFYEKNGFVKHPEGYWTWQA